MFQFYEPQGSSIAFPKLLTGEPIDAFCERVVVGCGVFLLPAHVYVHQQSVNEGRFRLGLGRQSLQEGLDALETYLTSSHKIGAQ